MSERERDIITELAAIFPKLDEKKQSYILGYAEGMAEMKDDMNKSQLQEA